MVKRFIRSFMVERRTETCEIYEGEDRRALSVDEQLAQELRLLEDVLNDETTIMAIVPKVKGAR